MMLFADGYLDRQLYESFITGLWLECLGTAYGQHGSMIVVFRLLMKRDTDV